MLKNKIINLKLTTGCGDSFQEVAKKSKDWATEKDTTVEFDFNGVLCLVNKETVLDWLFRDYCNANIMEWKSVGTKCAAWYDTDTEIKLYSRKLESAKKRKEQELEMAKKDNEEKEKVLKMIGDINIELKDEKAWNEYKEINKDPYGACCVEYAEMWARLMQKEINKGSTVVKCAETTSHQLGYLGITGFMYGAAVSMLSKCWKHGEDLRKWHNKEYKHEGECVVNPASLTIQTN